MLNIFSTQKGAIIKIAYGCNHKCYFCHERENIFSYDFRNILLNDLKDIYTWIIENGFDYVIISWWEPTLHPDLIDIIKFFQEKDIYVVIVNNGSHLHKHDFSRIDPKKITFYISYHGLEKEYNDITASSDFQRVTENIHSIRKMFPEVILRYVINNKNIDTFDNYTQYVLNKFPWVYLEYVLVEDLRYKHVKETFIEIADFYKQIFRYIDNKYILLDGGAACFHTYLFQKAEEKFDPLVNTMLWLVKKTKEGKILYSIKKEISPENIKLHWSKCKTCVKYDYCHGFDVSYVKKN